MHPYRKDWDVTVDWWNVVYPTTTNSTMSVDVINLAGSFDLNDESKIISALSGKLYLMKFENNEWIEQNAHFIGKTATITMEVSNPKDFANYRVELRDIGDLTVNAHGKDQRIKIDGRFNRYIYQGPVHCYDHNSANYTIPSSGSHAFINEIRIDKDKQGRNVKLYVTFDPISHNSDDYYLSTAMNINNINDFVKLAYRESTATAIASFNALVSHTDLCYIKIESVNVISTSKIVLTLDSGYTVSSTPVALLLAPGFKYANANIIFGDYAHYEYDYFDWYGNIEMDNLPLHEN